MAPTLKPLLLLVLAPAAAAPTSAEAAPVREVRLPHAAPTADTGSVAYDRGYLAWVERAGTGKRRLVVLRPDGTRRSEVVRGDVRIELRHGVDQRTGREVSRLVSTRHHRNTGQIVSTYRSPVTLRRIETNWPPVTPTTASDRGRSVTITTAAEPTAPTAIGESGAPSSCLFAMSGGSAPPMLSDCAAGQVWLQGNLLVSSTSVPSKSSRVTDRGSLATSALDVFSFEQPADGWRRLSMTSTDGYITSGLQSWCASEHGIAVLQGERRQRLDQPVATWTVRWVPTNPSQQGWSAEVPQLDGTVNHDGGRVSLACVDTTVYAAYLPLSKAGAPLLKGNQIVRWLAPAGV